MAFQVLFIFGYFVAPPLIGLCALGLLGLLLAPGWNAEHPRVRRALAVTLIGSSGAGLLLAGFILANSN